MFLNSDSVDQRCISLGIRHFQCFWNLKWCSSVVFKWRNNRMQKGIMKCGRWTNDVGIYAESVVISQKSRKCFGGGRAYCLLRKECKIQEWKYGQLITVRFMSNVLDSWTLFTGRYILLDECLHSGPWIITFDQVKGNGSSRVTSKYQIMSWVKEIRP